MNATVAADRRRRVLAELGVTRWRLRSQPVLRLQSAAKVETVSATPVLAVCAPDCAAPPNVGVAARIWPQVLTWLGRSADEIEWKQVASDAAIELPATSEWGSAEGKRALWRALKAHASRRG